MSIKQGKLKKKQKKNKNKNKQTKKNKQKKLVFVFTRIFVCFDANAHVSPAYNRCH